VVTSSVWDGKSAVQSCPTRNKIGCLHVLFVGKVVDVIDEVKYFMGVVNGQGLSSTHLFQYSPGIGGTSQEGTPCFTFGASGCKLLVDDYP
jgi:hypothetical protein